MMKLIKYFLQKKNGDGSIAITGVVGRLVGLYEDGKT